MKIALAQINTHIGDLKKNAGKILDFSEKARCMGAELVLFPELALTGYPPKDLLEKNHFLRANQKAIEELARKIQGIDALVGFAEPNPEKTGKPVYNAAAFLSGGKIDSVYRKNLLPTYDVFDEGRYFEEGKETRVLKRGGEALGVSICEDIWNDEHFLGRKLYPFDPIENQVKAGAQVLLNLSASPYHMGKEKLRLTLLSETARRHGKPLLYLNLVGGNDDLIFDGASCVFDAHGALCARLKSFEEDLQVVDTQALTPVSSTPEEPMELLRRALVLGTRDYLEKSGFKKAVIGLSGGIDSTLVAFLAVQAIGAENVLGVSMPSPFSSPGSLTDAEALAKNLKMEYRVVPIGNLYQEFQHSLHWTAETKKGKVDTALQNIQARLRGNLLMALSNREGRILLSTGNKSEMAVGYCTLYGDMAGGLAVISDLPKTLVYQLSRHMNEKVKAIPESVFTKAPSAELAPDQRDQDDLPPYEILDEILKRYVEEDQGAEEIIRAGFSEKEVRDVIRRIDGNEYKRKQAPPGLRVTSKAFGYGRRIPITNAFRE